MRVTLTKIYRSDKDKQGNTLLTRDGRAYTRCSIKTDQHGDTWVSGFGNRTTDAWVEGDVVEIEVEKKGEYTNFSLQKKGISRDEFDALVMRVVTLEKEVLFKGLDAQDTPPEVIGDDTPPF